MKQKRKRISLTQKEYELIDWIRLIPRIYPRMSERDLIFTAQELFDELIVEAFKK